MPSRRVSEDNKLSKTTLSSQHKDHRSASVSSSSSSRSNAVVTKKLSPVASRTNVNTSNPVDSKAPQTTHLHPVKVTNKNGFSDSQKVVTKSSGDKDKSQATETTQSSQAKKPEQLLVASSKSAAPIRVPEEKDQVVKPVNSESEKSSVESNTVSTKASDCSQESSHTESSVQVQGVKSTSSKSTEQPQECVDKDSNPQSQTALAKNEESGSGKTQEAKSDAMYVMYIY